MLFIIPLLVFFLSCSLHCDSQDDKIDHSQEILRNNPKLARRARLMVPVFMLKNPQKQGYMTKLGGKKRSKNWKTRWFVLKKNKLYYYESNYDIQALGIVYLYGYKIEDAPKEKRHKYAFKAVKKDSRTWYFHTETFDEKNSWMEHMQRAAEIERESPDSFSFISGDFDWLDQDHDDDDDDDDSEDRAIQ